MTDEKPQVNINREVCPVKGFQGIQGRYLRFPHDVLDKAECDHCQYIPKEVYYLRCLKHKLCPECKHYYSAYYCNKCGVNTSNKELSDAVRCINDEAKHLRVLCPICEEEMRLELMEDHYQECPEMPWFCIFCKGNVLLKEWTKHLLQCPGRLVRCENCKTFYAYSLEKKHQSECPKIERKCSDGGVNVLNESLQNNKDMECQEQLVFCDTCYGIMIYEDLGTHKYQCPLMERECSDCGDNVLNVNLQIHLDLWCRKRMVYCHACDSTMCYDERGDHYQECPEMLVVCDDCSGKVLRKNESKHASECPMRVVHCENCEGFYAYSSEKEHREQCEIKKLACEYCKLEVKGDDEKNAHHETCEYALIECAFKEFGCSEKASRKEMQEHKNDPHNAVLNQVILKAMDTISELQQKVKEMERCNMSQQEEARNEKARLEKRIQELENRQLEADQYRIDLEDDVKVYRTVLQNLEDKVGRISKEAATRRRVEMLNERVETYLGPLERLLNGLRQVDKE